MLHSTLETDRLLIETVKPYQKMGSKSKFKNDEVFLLPQLRCG